MENDKNTNYTAIISYLEDNKFEFGYATYWNSNIITVLSNDKVEVANLSYKITNQPYLWVTPSRYYQSTYHPGKTFLLLTDEEAEIAKSDPNLLQGAKLDMAMDGYKIYTYDRNPFNFKS